MLIVGGQRKTGMGGTGVVPYRENLAGRGRAISHVNCVVGVLLLNVAVALFALYGALVKSEIRLSCTFPVALLPSTAMTFRPPTR
jgi:hypothetical protein